MKTTPFKVGDHVAYDSGNLINSGTITSIDLEEGFIYLSPDFLEDKVSIPVRIKMWIVS